MNTTQTLPWDVTEHLQTQEDIAAYLEAALEEGDPELIIVALKDIARCQKMKQIIEQNNKQNDRVYQALLTDNNLDFATILKALKMFGLRLQAIVI
ncbi:MAG: putative addiction module antidote protein [Snowella sp.]|jgi:probable addiction module antidote protein|nr:MAG: putative addiction module antidote protein [Snowella sp.]